MLLIHSRSPHLFSLAFRDRFATPASSVDASYVVRKCCKQASTQPRQHCRPRPIDQPIQRSNGAPVFQAQDTHETARQNTCARTQIDRATDRQTDKQAHGHTRIQAYKHAPGHPPRTRPTGHPRPLPPSSSAPPRSHPTARPACSACPWTMRSRTEPEQRRLAAWEGPLRLRSRPR